MLYSLWDARLKVGHATRSVDECIRLAQDRQHHPHRHSRSALHLRRPTLFEELDRAAFARRSSPGGAKAFIASKLGERDERHHKAGASRYLVEPDVKDGKGGLRDLHTLFWIAKFIYAAPIRPRNSRSRARSRARNSRVFKKMRGLPVGGALPSAFPVGARR